MLQVACPKEVHEAAAAEGTPNIAKDGVYVLLETVRRPQYSNDNFTRCIGMEEAYRAVCGCPFLTRLYSAQHGRSSSMFLFKCWTASPMTLEQWVQAKSLAGAKILTCQDVAAILRNLSGGMGALHQAGWIHGGINPGNVWINAEGEALLVNFEHVARIRTPVVKGARATDDVFVDPEVCIAVTIAVSSLGILASMATGSCRASASLAAWLYMVSIS